MDTVPATLRGARWALVAQGWLYVVTGLWPVAHLSSFERVTGEKYDDFLVHTVGLLLFVIGAGLLRALRARQPPVEIVLVASGSALALALIDVVYVANGRLSPIYLLDAGAELVFVLAGVAVLRARARDRGADD
ncbi:MAG: hypothetical protein K0R70_66 [Steroidobacteraceae bacterium]|nr:hypothetical protein [Steroidobacteraceae bacterium]